ncbi:putative mediator of RNA polymerase II transcription subunitc [Sesamum angolense]|uniref:Mediator of RNA polymerase II transcription subunitc n=1 Tax=Sesamum angolense TaxID=2727404 RepID=A0AAE1WJM5_9LAMI|nr:putative mediator of RNA polymerase II transcription subunitc [Sesamum angolense]
MDSEEIRSILSRSGVGIWALIEAAIGVASSDYGEELRRRRDRIVESLYVPPAQLCRNCNGGVQDDGDRDGRFYNRSNNVNNSSDDVDNKDDHENNKKFSVDDDKDKRNLNEDFSKSPLTPESNHRNFSGGEEEEEDVDPYAGLFDDEQTKILNIKEQLEDPQQSEDGVVELLQTLADMDITFQALKETDIGRHVNRLRKHPSNEVRRLVKQLVRKWKETVDEWVKVNQPQQTSNLIADVDSPQQNIPKNQQNGHHQVPDFGYSPNPRNGNSGAERNHVEHETKPKALQSAPRREAPSRPPQSAPKSASAPPPNRAQREPVVDDERLNSARRRLQENYQEAENGLKLNSRFYCSYWACSPYTHRLFVSFPVDEAKRQRTIQVMDIHELPKPKNAFFAKNKVAFRADTIGNLPGHVPT